MISRVFWPILFDTARLGIISLQPDLKSLPNDKVFDKSKLKVFAYDKINVNQKSKITLGRVEKILGKGVNPAYQHFLLLPQCFQKPTFYGLFNVRIAKELHLVTTCIVLKDE